MGYTLMPGVSHSIGTEAETLELVRTVLVDDFEEQRRAQIYADSRNRKEAMTPEMLRAASHAKFEPLKHPVDIAAETRSAPPERYASFIAVALLLVVRPLFVIVPVLSLIVLSILTFRVFGPERIWRWTSRRLDRIERRNKAKAAHYRRKLELAAYHWDRVLDLFPSRVVGHLYVPDFYGNSADGLNKTTSKTL